MRRLILALAAALSLTACAEPTWAPDEAVRAAAFVSDEPPSITLFTVLNKRTGAGAHSGLLINASQRVMYDPAGSWYHPRVPERNDLHYGITRQMQSFYIDYHARETFDVVEQTIQVSPQVAEIALQRAMAQGAAPKAFCANYTSAILSGVPGFEGIDRTFFPDRLSESFARITGVQGRRITDDDADKNHNVLLTQADQAPAAE